MSGLGPRDPAAGQLQGRRELFPVIPSQSRYNRRRRHLHQAFNLVRRAVLGLLDLAEDRQCAIDLLPVPVVGFHLAPCASRDWAVNGACFGRVAPKRRTIYGYKLHLLVTLGGVILDFALAPAHVSVLEAGVELLSGHTDPDAYGDMGYTGRAVYEPRGNGVTPELGKRRPLRSLSALQYGRRP